MEICLIRNILYFYDQVFFVFVQNEVQNRSSLVSKSLPIKNKYLVSCLFSAGNKKDYALPYGSSILYQFRIKNRFPYKYAFTF